MTDTAIDDRSSRNDLRPLRLIWQWVKWPFVVLLFLGALGSRGQALLHGIAVLVDLVDLYRGLVYPVIDCVHTHFWRSDWYWPTKPMFDGGLIGLTVSSWTFLGPTKRLTTNLRVDLGDKELERWARRSFIQRALRYQVLAIACIFAYASAFAFNDLELQLVAIAAPAVLYLGLFLRELYSQFWNLPLILWEAIVPYLRNGLVALTIGLALVSIRELNARADIALPLVERWETAFWQAVADIQRDGLKYRPEPAEQIHH